MVAIWPCSLLCFAPVGGPTVAVKGFLSFFREDNARCLSFVYMCFNCFSESFSHGWEQLQAGMRDVRLVFGVVVSSVLK